MLKRFELHNHTTESDAHISCAELLNIMLRENVDAFALTDHDCVEGLDTILSYAKSLPNAPEIIPGIDLSTDENGQEVHMVGLFIDHHNPEFNQYLQEFIASRTTRNKKMCHLLQEHGMNITYEELEAEFPGAVLTRAHYAKLLLKHGYVKSIKEAFERFLGDHCPCYVSREKITPVMAIDLIRKAGGLAIIAHPI